MRKLIILIIFLNLAGCVFPGRFEKGYDGLDFPSEELALLKPTNSVKIEYINEKYIGASGMSSFGNVEHEISILPGEHLILVSYKSLYVESAANITLKLNALAAHKYIIKSNVEGGSWRPEILDVTDTPKCWTVMVGIISGPKC